MNLSSARKARRSNGAGHVETQDYECPAQATREAVVAPYRQRPSAPVGVPLVEAHLCAGDRRPQGRDAGVGFFAGEVDAGERQHWRQHRRGEGRRQAVGGTRREERRQGSRVRPWRLSLSRPRQGAGRCGARKRPEFLVLTIPRGLGPRRDWKAPWQVNANAADATGTGSARSVTASSSTSSSTSIAWRRWSRAASASVSRRWL